MRILQRETKAVIKKSDYNNKPYDKISELIKIKKHVSGLSAGIRLMKIASGKMDFYFEGSYRASKWDTCGTQVILEEAGGKIIITTPSPLNWSLLEILSTLGLQSRREIVEHESYFFKKSLIKLLTKAGFKNIKHEYFEFWLNNLVTATK